MLPADNQPKQRYRLLDKTREHNGVTLRRMYWIGENREGGWLGSDAVLPQDGTAVAYDDALLIGGEFWGGGFRGGVFWRGEFWGGVFHAGVFRASPVCAQRSDGYMFVAKIVDGQLRIWAGCRNFSWDEAMVHWSDWHKHGKETQVMLHYLKEKAELEGDVS